MWHNHPVESAEGVPLQAHPRRWAFALTLCFIFLCPVWVLAHVSPWPEGTIAGVRVPPALLDVIDPGGHDVDPGGIRCSDCLTAFVNDGYCRPSHIGYVDGRAYVSRLAYLLVKDGVPVNPKAISCAQCRAHLNVPGWCDQCGRGLVGNLAVSSHSDFNEILMERERLMEAVRLASRCDLCAVAFYARGRCSRCHIDYRAPALSAASTR